MAVKKHVPPHIPAVQYDKNDSSMHVGTIYTNMAEFRLAIVSHAIKNEFEFDITKSDPGRLEHTVLPKEMVVSRGFMHQRWVMECQ